MIITSDFSILTWKSDSCILQLLNEQNLTYRVIFMSHYCGPVQKHQQGPITCSKWSGDSDQDKGIECIGFECFNQVRIERFIRVSRGYPSTSYPWARGVQHNLIWAMRWGQQRKQKNPSTTWKQHGWLPFPFVSRIKGLHGRLYNKPWISSIIFYFLLFFSW